MKDFLPFIIVGLVTGSVYGLTGMGLVLTYKTSGVFNFAHGAVATVGAYAFYELRVQRELPWPVAIVLAVVVVGAAIGLVMERLARALASVSPALQIVSTVGILIAVQGVAVARWGAAARSVPAYLPVDNLRIAGVNVGVDQIIVFLVALAAATGLYLFFRSTTLGLSMQAVVDDPALLATGGTSPVRVRTIAWIIGSVFACLSGVLLVPTTGLDAGILTLLVVQAFGAAAVGAFSSLPLSYVGGLAVGLVASLSTRYVGDVRWLAGFPSAVPFLVLFVALLVMPKRRLAVFGEDLRLHVKPPPALPRPARIAGLTVLGLLLVAIPELVGARLPVYTTGLVYVVVFLSLYLLVRTSGQVSLAHVGFAAVGGAAFAHLTGGLDLPWGLALLGAGLLTVPVGALVAIPAIRLSGLYLAVATFGFGILLQRLVYRTGLMFGAAGARDVPRPDGFETDTRYYYLVLLITALMAVLALGVIKSRLGRLLRAMADAPVALTTGGTSVSMTRLIIFCISAFMAGIAGTLFAAVTQSVNGTSFGYFLSLEWLTVLVIAGAGFRYAPIPTAVLGGVLIAIIPSYLDSPTFHDYLPVLFGVSAIANALITDREHGPPRAKERAQQAERLRSRSPVAARMEAQPRAEVPT